MADKDQEWHSADKRPPREGRYLVWGVHHVIPDHCDQPHGYWDMRFGYWSNRYGWGFEGRVKYWRELPEPPKGVKTYD